MNSNHVDRRRGYNAGWMMTACKMMWRLDFYKETIPDAVFGPAAGPDMIRFGRMWRRGRR